MTRSRTLETVGEVERRLRAVASIAAALAVEAADRQRRNRIEFTRDLHAINAGASRTAFACAASAHHRIVLAATDVGLLARRQAAEESARVAREAAVRWAQIRCGLERRRARLAVKPPS